MPQEIQLFAGKQIRTYWDDEAELYYFCIIDVVETLTDSNDPKQYIKRMRQRDAELNSVWGTICTPHQFISSDGKRHQVNCAPLDGIFRIIQSIPSKKAELTTTNITKEEHPITMGEHAQAASRGGSVARVAREAAVYAELVEVNSRPARKSSPTSA